ncbi:hypothetical protein C8Z91_11325 [Paenibacillus elgii]|uniref:Uncharacterized protein n=1 Tax=Paenibacillus elgii TaxID=189691 RepID=A0A2T6G4G9_9BACL|nr:hypothetical protein C8Z91_11325 [Paenibacillus elgii]
MLLMETKGYLHTSNFNIADDIWEWRKPLELFRDGLRRGSNKAEVSLILAALFCCLFVFC